MINSRAYLAIAVVLLLVIGGALYFRSDKNPDQVPLSETATTTSGTSTAPMAQGEDSAQETFRKQPGAITFVEQIGEGAYWSFSVDLLTPNPKWIPGGSDETGGFFLNQNARVRQLAVTEATAAYRCDGPEATRRVVAADFVAYLQDVLRRSKTEQGIVGEFGYTAYFDIDGGDIRAIYEQCLP